MVDKGGDMVVKGFLTMIIGGIISFIALSIGITSYFLHSILMIIVIIGFSVVMVGIMKIMTGQKEEENQRIKNEIIFQNKYDEYVNKFKIVKSDTQVTLIDANENNNYVLQYLWVKNEILHIFPTPKYYIQYYTSSTTVPDVAKLKLRSIPIDSISYYEEVGELDEYEEAYRQEVRVYNPVTDRMEPKERIKTKKVVEDNREVELVYENGDDEVEVLVFKHDAYEALKKLIPSKDLVMIRRKQKVCSIKKKNK